MPSGTFPNAWPRFRRVSSTLLPSGGGNHRKLRTRRSLVLPASGGPLVLLHHELDKQPVLLPDARDLRPPLFRSRPLLRLLVQRWRCQLLQMLQICAQARPVLLTDWLIMAGSEDSTHSEIILSFNKINKSDKNGCC